MHMLNDIISNEFIDDKLSKFLNILSGGADAELLLQSPSDHHSGGSNTPQDQIRGSNLSPNSSAATLAQNKGSPRS